MPNWEGIEDASAMAARVWLARPRKSEKEDSEEWKPLRKSDSQTLNRVTGEDIKTKSVYIECGRATAFIAEHVIRYNFVRGCERSLCSAVWFRKEESKGKDTKPLLHPIVNEEDGEKIESLYQQAITASGSLSLGISSMLKEEVTLSDESIVKLHKFGNTLKLVLTNKGWFAAQFTLQRGYGEYNIEGEDNETALGPVRQLVFVIHGIGEAYFSREEVKVASILQSMDQLRLDVQTKQVDHWRQLCKVKKQTLPPPPRIEFLPIEWFGRLHDSSSALMRSLQLTTLQTIPALRAIANDVVFDVLMYLVSSLLRYMNKHCHGTMMLTHSLI